MARFFIYEPPGARGEDAAAKACLVRDGFSFWGFLVPPLWLLWHRLYVEAALVFAALLAVGVLGDRVEGMSLAASGLTLLLSIYVGLEGPALRMAALRRRRWRESGTVGADSLADAEVRFIMAEQEDMKREEGLPASPLPWSPAAPRPGRVPELGLLTYPRGA